jgi:hypothetical protein
MILAFLSHQIVLSTTIIRDLMPLAFLDCRLPNMVMNHSCIVASILHVVFRNRGHEAHLAMAVKTWLVTDIHGTSGMAFLGFGDRKH